MSHTVHIPVKNSHFSLYSAKYTNSTVSSSMYIYHLYNKKPHNGSYTSQISYTAHTLLIHCFFFKKSDEKIPVILKKIGHFYNFSWYMYTEFSYTNHIPKEYFIYKISN